MISEALNKHQSFIGSRENGETFNLAGTYRLTVHYLNRQVVHLNQPYLFLAKEHVMSLLLQAIPALSEQQREVKAIVAQVLQPASQVKGVKKVEEAKENLIEEASHVVDLLKKAFEQKAQQLEIESDLNELWDIERYQLFLILFQQLRLKIEKRRGTFQQKFTYLSDQFKEMAFITNPLSLYTRLANLAENHFNCPHSEIFKREDWMEKIEEVLQATIQKMSSLKYECFAPCCLLDQSFQENQVEPAILSSPDRAVLNLPNLPLLPQLLPLLELPSASHFQGNLNYLFELYYRDRTAFLKLDLDQLYLEKK